MNEDLSEASSPSTTGPVVLIVRDGWGHNPHPEQNSYNALQQAATPRSDALLREYPSTLIKTSGEDVGLPEGTMGNSEVGHQNLGAGRIVDQESVRITKEIRSGAFFENQTLAEAVEQGKTVHLLGIASDAGVHGLITHLEACIELCRRHGKEKVRLHLFTDGRDTGPFTGKGYVEEIEAICERLETGTIASLCGRYWAMDRDNRWERVRRAYDCLTGRGEVPCYTSAADAIQAYYDEPDDESRQGDEFVTPRIIETGEDARIRDGDTVIFYNYRGDRPREITKAFVYDDFYGHMPPSPDSEEKGFDRGEKIALQYVTLTAYEEALNDHVRVAYPKPPKMEQIGGAYLAELGLRQLRCAETEKFPHVTFFFNDYREEPFPGERRFMAQSPRVATYDQQPEMSAREICDAVLESLGRADCEHFILINFANTDMVGHTGKLDAAVRAAETVDALVGEIVDAALARGGKLIITADHGNSEQMWDPETEAPHTAHTTYDVELIVVDPDRSGETLRDGGRLADVFPTVLDLLGLEKPDAMSGYSLLAGEEK